MKLKLTTILYVIALLLSAACSNEEVEKKLEGTWHAQYDIEDEDGDVTTIKIQMELNRPDNDFTLILDFYIQPIGKIATVKCKGDWMADEDDLMLDIDTESISFKYSNNVKLLAGITGFSISGFEELFELQIKDTLEGFGYMPIKSIYKDKIVLEMDDNEKVTFTRVETTSEIEDETGNDLAKQSGDEELIYDEYEAEGDGSEHEYYRGKIDGEEITMDLTYYDGSISGRYSYEDSGWYYVKGDYDGEYMNLAESDDYEKNSATIRLRFDHSVNPVVATGNRVDNDGNVSNIRIKSVSED